MPLYVPLLDQFLIPGLHPEIPEDAIEIDAATFERLIDGRSAGGRISILNGSLVVSRPLPNAADLCAQVDNAADRARRAVAGDPLRAVEYDRAAAEAQAFADAGYQGDVPPMVAAWAIGGRTPQQAADSILAEAEQYNAALVQLRTTRLLAKALIRAAMAAGNQEQAEDIAAETIASIEASVAGIGNNT